LVVATLIGTATALVNSSPAYALVLVWAFFGIYSRHTSPFEYDQQYPSIILTVQILLVVLVVVSVGALVKWLKIPLK
jgi:cell division protein FtsX